MTEKAEQTEEMENMRRETDWASLKSIYNSSLFCSLGFFYVAFILPIMAVTMEADAIQVGMIFASFTLGIAVFSPLAGRIVKRKRRRQAIFAGALFRSLSYIGMAMAIYLGLVDLLILNSLVWGCGAAFYYVGSDAEISERAINENRAEAFGRREAANARGSIIGAFTGFSLLIIFNGIVPFLFFAATSLLGGVIVLASRVPPIEHEALVRSQDRQAAIAVGIVALVIAAAIDAFGMSLLAPFVELFILERFTTDIVLIALIYLPPGIIISFVSGPIGRYADKANKIHVIAFASLIGFATNIMLVIALDLWWIAAIFIVQTVVGTAGHTVMSSVFGTAYEGKADEGFGHFRGVLAFARFIAPIVGGMMWVSLNPAAPFVMVGIMELLLVPVYYVGMKRYQQALLQQATELENE